MQHNEHDGVARLTPGALALWAMCELNHPITAALASAMQLKRLCRKAVSEGDCEQLENVAAQIEHWVGRCGQIVVSMRALGRSGEPALSSETLERIVAGALYLVGRDPVHDTSNLILRIEDPATRLVCDPAQIEQAVARLVINAMEACADRPVPQVTIRARLTEEGVEIAVDDNGPGLFAGADETNFEPFFTTKLNGVGLGLPIARCIVEAHGGRIRCEPIAGGGTCVRFNLPTAAITAG